MLDGQLLLAGRQHDFGLAVVGAIAPARKVDDHGCAAVDLSAFAGARPDDQRAGVEHEDRRVDLSRLDLQLLLGAGFAEPRLDHIVARLQRALVVAVFGGEIVAAAAVGLGLDDFPGLSVVSQRRAARGHDQLTAMKLNSGLAGFGAGCRGRLGASWPQAAGGSGAGAGSGACLDRRRRDDRRRQRIRKRCRVGRLQIFAAGVFGEAGDLPALFRGQAEADDMGGEVDAGLLPAPCRARRDRPRRSRCRR